MPGGTEDEGAYFKTSPINCCEGFDCNKKCAVRIREILWRAGVVQKGEQQDTRDWLRAGDSLELLTHEPPVGCTGG